MKHTVLIAAILLSMHGSYAQSDTDFYKHEIRAAIGDAIVTSELRLKNKMNYTNVSFSYFYRPYKSLWVGANFVNYFGEKIYYNWREYDVDGSFKDFSKSKMKYFAIIAPEIRLTYLDKKAVILYGSLAGGIGLEYGYDTKHQKYPNTIPCCNLTYFGLSCKFGKNDNIFLGSELGIGFKGLISAHGGYRF